MLIISTSYFPSHILYTLFLKSIITFPLPRMGFIQTLCIGIYKQNSVLKET